MSKNFEVQEIIPDELPTEFFPDKIPMENFTEGDKEWARL